MCHEEIVVIVHGSSSATEVVSVRVAHGEVRDPVGCAYQSDIPSRFVASKSSQCVDVQLNGLDDHHAVRLLDAVADRAEPRDTGCRSDGGSVVVTVESAGGSTSSEPSVTETEH